MNCEYCDTPFIARLKFNNGNPKIFNLPECSCEERITEKYCDEFIERLRALNNEIQT